jgi:hypothetical protein
MAKNINQFNLEGFEQLPDGSFRKKKTVEQPRNIKVKTLLERLLPMENAFHKAMQKNQGHIEEAKKKQVYFKNQDIKQVYADAESNGYIYIPGNVPSLKNSKQIFTNKKTGKSFISSSELCKKYIEDKKTHLMTFKPRFLKLIEGKSYPLTIQFFFIRDKHKPFDYGNITQIVLDCMTGNAYYPPTKDKIINAERKIKRGRIRWIEDDDADHLIPNYAAGYGYDPKLAGVIIKVLW